MAVLLLCNMLCGAPFQKADTTGLKGEQTQLNGVCVFHDFSGVTLANLDREIPKRMFKLLSGKLPVRLGAIYILDPPWFVSYIVFPILKLFMPSKLRSRIHLVYGKENLGDFFEKDQLLEEYGGSAKDPGLDGIEQTLISIVREGEIEI